MKQIMIPIARSLSRTCKLLLIGLILIAGCAHVPIGTPPVEYATPEDIGKAKEIWQKIEERGKTAWTNPEWISNSGATLKIKSLSNVPTGKYPDYKKFLDRGRVYIINHPGYYAFFHHPKMTREDSDIIKKNIMDMFLESDYASFKSLKAMNEDASDKGNYSQHVFKIMKEFERVERNFIEFKSTEQKLVILILPGDYKEYPNYRYKNGFNEYVRYINEVTNMSDSALYLESKKPNRGQLQYEDMNTLMEFLQKIGATSILLGGEYVGRCEEDFYKQLIESAGTALTVELVPELSPVSPDDMNSSMKDLLDSNDKLDIEATVYNILRNAYGKLDDTPKMRHLPGIFYEKPSGK